MSEAKAIYDDLIKESSSDQVVFWVNDEKLDELLHSKFSPSYEDEYYVLSKNDWSRFQDLATSNGFEMGEDFDEAYDLSGRFVAVDDDESTFQEASTTAGIVGYEAPLGSNPAGSKLKDLYGQQSRYHEDDDEKIRNLGSENSRPYVKKHPINKITRMP